MSKRMQLFQDAFMKYHPDYEELCVKTITFIVTEACQLNCSYCYQNHKTSTVMSYDTGVQFIDLIFNEMNNNPLLNDTNTRAVILEFIGGEPLLEIELIDRLVEYYKFKASITIPSLAINYMVSISTNGILADAPKVLSFMEKNYRRVSLGITIDGNKKLHDSCRRFHNGDPTYDIVEKNAKLHISKYAMHTTKLTIAPSNVEYLHEAILNLWTLGLTDIHANCVYEEGWTHVNALTLYDQMKKIADYLVLEDRYKQVSVSLFSNIIGKPHSLTDNQNWCGGTGKMLAFSPDGNVYPCLRYCGYCTGEEQEKFVIGDIHTGLIRTEAQKNIFNFLEKITRKSQSTDECFNCPISHGCGWCSAYNYEVFGTPNKRATFICVMHKARVMANYYYFSHLFKLGFCTDKPVLNIPKEWALEIIDESEYDTLVDLTK